MHGGYSYTNTSWHPHQASTHGVRLTPTLNHKRSFNAFDHEIAKSFATINDCMTSLATLQNGFIFPDHIDFTDVGSTKEPLDLLSHTRHNKPLLRYIKALHDLCVELRAIESFNDSNVRKSRNLVIDRVEEALETIADEVGKRVKRPGHSHPKLKSILRPQKPDHISFINVVAHVPNSLPLPPLPSRDVCRQIAGDSKFTKAFKSMAHKTTNLQLDRLKALSRGNTTSKWDHELAGLSTRWNHQVDRALKDAEQRHSSRRHRLT